MEMFVTIAFIQCLLSLATCENSDPGRYLIGSQPILFIDDNGADSQVYNSTLILKKKGTTSSYSGGPVYYDYKKHDTVINNHHVPEKIGATWKRPQAKPTSFSNHKAPSTWKKHHKSKPSPKPIYEEVFSDEITVNNHQSNQPVKRRPQQPMSVVTVLSDSKLPANSVTDILGGRLKPPETIRSSPIHVSDDNVQTVLKHNKILVAKKSTNNSDSRPSERPGNFSVAPVMDPWSNIPIPSKPSWARPVKGGALRPSAAQTVLPNLPFMPWLTSLISPLMNKPLTPSALNNGLQGIKAMQGFLRNSLMGAMFCFLPSAFIALSLTATQRAELRQIPEMDDMMVFCKKCLENLKDIKDLALTEALKSEESS
ncbi:uncharacterized protein LOC129233950 [Uloborus diversus]|uniref:uncharacterized protein LOC129233950 n=1 Tax=Uloborus diversus TaxID=327109 RepID=UPI00240A3502|nr:uncharacterized protein LOC129233950 [Uloborus diversus]